MIKALIKGRVYVFIDGANIFYSEQTLGWRVDYSRLKQYFENECRLKRIYFYTGKISGNAKQNSFLNKLEKLGYIVRVKEVKKIRISENAYQWKANLDVELVIDVLDNLNNFDSLILLSGDSDFAPLLDKVKGYNKRVIVISAKGHIAVELVERAKYVNLRKLKDKIIFLK